MQSCFNTQDESGVTQRLVTSLLNCEQISPRFSLAGWQKNGESGLLRMPPLS
jgi:hypothetical protein